MALTLEELRDRLRFRLGDPSGNFISKEVIYSGGSATDEEAKVINDSARKLTADLYRNGVSMLTGRKKLAIEPNKREYALPEDLLGVQECFWEDSTTRYEIKQRPLQSFRDLNSTDIQPRYFDVFGQTAEIINARICNNTNDSTTVATIDVSSAGDYQANFDTGSVVTGRDKIFNLSDGSSGTITTTALTSMTASAGLTGGKTNTFRPNDRIQIERAEKTLSLFHINPLVSDSSYTTIADGVTTTFDPTTPYYLYGAKVTLSEVGTETHPLKVYLDDGDDTVDITAIDSRSVGTHEVVFPNNKILDTDNTYRLYVGGGHDTDNIVSSYDILGFNGDERLNIYYARYPMKMGTSTYSATRLSDRLELPEICLEALINQAVSMASYKAEGGINNESAQALAMYEMEVNKLVRFQRTRNIRGSRQVKNVMYSAY